MAQLTASEASDSKSHKHFVFGAPRTQELVMAVYLYAKYLEKWHTHSCSSCA